MSGEQVGVGEQESIQPRLDEISALLEILNRQIYSALSSNQFDEASLLLERSDELYLESVQRRAGTWKEKATS